MIMHYFLICVMPITGIASFPHHARTSLTSSGSTYKNIVFVIDGSNDVPADLFQEMKNFSSTVAEQLMNMEPSIRKDLQLAVIQYTNGLSYSEIPMGYYSSAFTENLRNLQQMNIGSSQVTKALGYAAEMILQFEGRTKIIVLFVVGEFCNDDFQKVLKDARMEGISISIIQLLKNKNNEKDHIPSKKSAGLESSRTKGSGKNDTIVKVLLNRIRSIYGWQRMYGWKGCVTTFFARFHEEINEV